MVNLETLAEELEILLNGENYANLTTYGLDTVTPDTIYAFNVCLDEGKYKAPERRGNTVIRYINAQISITNNQVEGTDSKAYHAVVDTNVDFLIPLVPSEDDDISLLARVRNLLTTTLQVSGQMKEEINDIFYLHTITYSIANTGYRDQVEKVGDCITLTLNISHQFVANGVSSDAYKIYVLNLSGGYDRVRYQRAGFARKTVYEANVKSTSTNASSSSIPSSTAFSMTIDMLTRLDTIDYMVKAYTLDGDLTPIVVRVNDGTRDRDYVMILDTSGINLELNLPSSTSISLIEGGVV